MNLKSLSASATCALIFLYSFAAIADQPTSNFDVSFGKRRDSFRSKVVNNDSSWSSSAALGLDEIRINEFEVYEAGLRGHWVLPILWNDCCCFTSCDNWYVGQFYLRYQAYWGWSKDGKWKEGLFLTFPSSDLSEIASKKIHDGQTRSYDIALAWLYPLTEDNCFTYIGVGPSVGFSYDSLRLKVHDPRVLSSLSESFSSDDGRKIFKSSFEGPYIGVDLRYQACDFQISSGYEFHWVNCWRAEVDFPGFSEGLSDHRKSHNGYGNVLFIDFSYAWCNCVEIGFGIDYRFYRAKHGRRTFELSSISSSSSSSSCHSDCSGSSSSSSISFPKDHAEAKWETVGVHVEVGVRF